ncbi:MAG: DMT family transporter [Patescibacteria group bacterium]|nr:DMT family transporter [Patescibacteria group bacterium]
MNWFQLSLLSAILMTVRGLLARFLLRNKGDARGFTILHDFFAGIAIIPFFFIYGFKFPPAIIPILGLLVATLVYAVGDITNIKSYQLEEASIVTPLIKLRVIIVLVGSAVFLHESITWLKLLAIIFVLCGSIIIGFEKGKFVFSKGVKYSLLSAFFLGCAFLLDKAFVVNYSLPVYMSTILFLPALWILISTKNGLQRSINELKLQKWGVVIAGLFFGWALFAFLAAISKGEVSRSTAVVELSLVFIAVGGYVFLNERKKLWQKIIGSLLILVGVLLVKI